VGELPPACFELLLQIRAGFASSTSARVRSASGSSPVWETRSPPLPDRCKTTSTAPRVHSGAEPRYHQFTCGPHPPKGGARELPRGDALVGTKSYFFLPARRRLSRLPEALWMRRCGRPLTPAGGGDLARIALRSVRGQVPLSAADGLARKSIALKFAQLLDHTATPPASLAKLSSSFSLS
jgi:hypothetical protein